MQKQQAFWWKTSRKGSGNKELCGLKLQISSAPYINVAILIKKFRASNEITFRKGQHCVQAPFHENHWPLLQGTSSARCMSLPNTNCCSSFAWFQCTKSTHWRQWEGNMSQSSAPRSIKWPQLLIFLNYNLYTTPFPTLTSSFFNTATRKKKMYESSIIYSIEHFLVLTKSCIL